MRKRRQIELFSLSFLDLISGALGAVIILYVAIPKSKPVETPKEDIVKELLKKDLASSQQTIEQLKKELEESKAKLAAIPAPVETKTDVVGGLDADIGFKFKGSNIVFYLFGHFFGGVYRVINNHFSPGTGHGFGNTRANA